MVYERRATSVALSTGKTIERAVEQIEVWCLEVVPGVSATGRWKGAKQARLLVSLSRLVDGRAEPMRGVVLSIDEYGRQELPSVTRSRLVRLDPIFEILPVQRFGLQHQSVWKTPPDLLGRQRRCTLVGSDTEQADHVRVDYVVDLGRGLDEAIGQTHTGRYWFDADAGLVTRVESVREDRMADTRVQAVTVLRSRDRRATGWIARRADEANRYLMTLAHEDRLLDEIVSQPDQIDQTLERLRRLWVGRAADFGAQAPSPFASLCRARLKELALEHESFHRDAHYARQWLGRRAVPWSLQDAGGQTVTSEELRTGIVVECLWSVSDPGFLATLDMMRELQRQLADESLGRRDVGRYQPIRVLCLNMDANVALGQRAIACLSLDHTADEAPAATGLVHVLAGPLRAVEPPPRLPVIRVLDQQGVIRRLWLGWQPSADPVAEAILPLAK